MSPLGARAATGWRVRRTRRRDLESLGELFATRFGHPLSAAQWEWKYRQAPGRALSYVGVAPDGRVAAHAGALGLPARAPAGEGRLWQLVDWVGSPAGSGLRPALVDTGLRLLARIPRRRDLPWIFGFPSERHFRLGERAFGYRPLKTLRPLLGPLPAGDAPPPPGGEVVELAGPWAEAAWEACGATGVRRGVRFLNWRYHARPERYYRLYRVGEPAPGAFAVFGFHGDEAWAAEAWFPPGPDWQGALRWIGADLAAMGLERWRFWPPPRPGLAASLRALGLEPAGEEIFVGCRLAADRGLEEDLMAAARRVEHAMGDWDVV